MTNPSLSRVTLQSLENYRTAATQAVVAPAWAATAWWAPSTAH